MAQPHLWFLVLFLFMVGKPMVIWLWRKEEAMNPQKLCVASGIRLDFTTAFWTKAEFQSTRSEVHNIAKTPQAIATPGKDSPTKPRASRENDAPVMVTGILGESAILPTEIPNGCKLENINWASRTSVALVQPEGQSVKIITTHQNYRDRLNVPPNTYNLKISPLKMEDAGSYRADINLQNPTTSTTFTVTKNYTLHVYRRLAPPKITLTFVASENNTCNITLTCFMEEKAEAVKYQWTPLGEQAVESNGKSSLFIFQRPEDAPISYTCTAINPVTNNSQSKLVQYPCAGMPMSSRSLWFILVPVLVLVPSAGILFYLQHKKKKDADSPSTSKVMALKDLPLSENRLYDEISMPKAIVSNPPKEEALNTIYYTVQKPQKIENSCSSATKLLGTSTNDSVI